MAVLLVTYDLKKPGQDYADFLTKIKSYDWARLSESSYTIQTNESPETLYNALRVFMGTNDQVYIVNLTNPFYGYGPQVVNEWLGKHLPI